MPEKIKITVEVPAYLKEWIDEHDLGQNALATLGLRLLYLQEQNVSESKIITAIESCLAQHTLPF
jgi:hypothetical protein